MTNVVLQGINSRYVDHNHCNWHAYEQLDVLDNIASMHDSIDSHELISSCIALLLRGSAQDA